MDAEENSEMGQGIAGEWILISFLSRIALNPSYSINNWTIFHPCGVNWQGPLSIFSTNCMTISVRVWFRIYALMGSFKCYVWKYYDLYLVTKLLMSLVELMYWYSRLWWKQFAIFLDIHIYIYVLICCNRVSHTATTAFGIQSIRLVCARLSIMYISISIARVKYHGCVYMIYVQ